MINKNKDAYRRKGFSLRIASVLLTLLFALMFAVPDFAYAVEETAPEQPVREVHNVGVGNGAYCFFVTHNVVLTPAQVAEMTDEDLTAYILEKAGLYMKKANCRSLKNDKIISVKDWTKKGGAFYLSEPDIEGIRAAEPVDGSPVKFYMDLIVCEKVAEKKSAETADTQEDEEGAESEAAEESEEPEDVPLYSTFKRNEPKLIFAVVATETDAAFGEDICKEDEPKKNNIKMPKIKESAESEDEMLPEYRTINMVDRSGKPIEATLEDGDPVKLEWIEPKHNGNEEGTSFIDRIPGGVTGLVIICAAAVAAIAGAIAAAGKKKRADW
ncbi:MAG: hypothetical protein IKG25_10725 [Mogibacterium sp.]|nr:hypothetical protein [Mogibacterium sp.]MBR3331656.1 hypothetical protein [Mogibacterium sp.]